MRIRHQAKIRSTPPIFASNGKRNWVNGLMYDIMEFNSILITVWARRVYQIYKNSITSVGSLITV